MGIAGATAIALLRGRATGAIRIIVLLCVIGIQVGLDIIVAHTVKAGHWSGLSAGVVIGYICSWRSKGQSYN